MDIEVEVRGGAADAGGDEPLLVLQERHDPQRGLLIWIGGPEALAVTAAGPDRATPAPTRPPTHRLLLDVLAGLGARLAEVRLTGIVAGQFHAELHLTPTTPPIPSPAPTPASTPTPTPAEGTGPGPVVSARPSDAVTLAVHQGCPILVSEAVLAEAGVPRERIATATGDPDTLAGEMLGAQAPAPAAIEDQVEQLREALTEATPDDFDLGSPGASPGEQPPEQPD